jgi:hypothetical protein
MGMVHDVYVAGWMIGRAQWIRVIIVSCVIFQFPSSSAANSAKAWTNVIQNTLVHPHGPPLRIIHHPSRVFLLGV